MIFICRWCNLNYISFMLTGCKMNYDPYWRVQLVITLLLKTQDLLSAEWIIYPCNFTI